MRTPAVPPDAPLNMRVQSLRKAPGRPPLYTPLRTHLARLIAFGGALAIGSLGTWHMLKAFGDGRSTLLQYAARLLRAHLLLGRLLHHRLPRRFPAAAPPQIGA